MEQSTESIWTDSLLLKLKTCNIAGNMFRWIKSYLHNRRARVVVCNTKRKKILLRYVYFLCYLVALLDAITCFHVEASSFLHPAISSGFISRLNELCIGLL